jgi:hypothetical protein
MRDVTEILCGLETIRQCIYDTVAAVTLIHAVR